MGRILTTSSFATAMPFGNGIVRLFKSSGTFVVPAGIKKLRVSCLGAGSGGLTSCHASSGVSYPNYGGSGGGFSSKVIDVSPGDTFSYTVGAGGVGRRQYAGVTILQAATAGGASSFGSVISATGGSVATSGSGAGSPGVVGTPGQGIGGDINYNGGRSGILQTGSLLPSGAFNFPYALGGGAGGHFYGDGGNGGDLYSIDNSNINAYQVKGAATGGGGAGGNNGGNIRGYAGYTDQYFASGGGGVGSAAATPATAYSTFPGGNSNTAYESYSGEDATAVPAIPAWNLLLPLLGAGQKSLLASNAWNGSGAVARGAGTAGALANPSYLGAITASSALVIGGGGAAVNTTNTDAYNATGGNGGYGGGGGAACAGSGLNLYITGGNGGQGLVMVEF